jgi:hypothetical protein
MMIWHDKLFLIDHGAAFYQHHDWPAGMGRGRGPFPKLKDHVLLPFAADLASVDEELTASLSDEVLTGILADIPEKWLPEPAEESRALYLAFLRARLAAPRPFLPEAHRG